MASMRDTADDPGRAFRRRLHRRYALYTLGVIAFILALGLAERRGLSRSWIGAGFLVGTAGVLYLQGFAGLAYILGWTGGYCLVAILLAPYLRRFGRFTIPEFLAARYGGRAPRLIGVAATVLVCFVYVVVQVYGVGLITSHLTGFSFEIGIFVGLGGVLVCSFLGGMRAVTWTQVAQYIVLLIAYTVPVVWLSIQQTGSWIPQIDYGRQLRAVTAREAQLRDDAGEREVRALFARRAADAQRKLADVPAAITEDAAALAREIERLRAADAPLAKIQQAERRLARMPRNVDDARAAYQRERDAALNQARPLGGLAPQAEAHPAQAPPSADRAIAMSYGEGTARRNFLALMLCLMLGTAAMPHVLTRYYTTPSVAETRSSVAWSLFFIVALYVSAPCLAVMVKYDVLNHVVGTPFGSLPAWIRRWSRLDPAQISVEDINGDGVLQLSELRLGGDLIVMAAPEIGGLPLVVTYLVAAGALAAALSTADGLLLTMSNTVSYDFFFRYVNPRASSIRRVMLSKLTVLVMAVLAAWVASLRIAEILPFVTAAFSLAAAAFFPALVMGIFWRRANRAGAVAAMVVGLGVCAWYMATGLPAPRSWLGLAPPSADSHWFGIDPMAAGVFGVPAGMVALVLVSLATPPPAQAERAKIG